MCQVCLPDQVEIEIGNVQGLPVIGRHLGGSVHDEGVKLQQTLILQGFYNDLVPDPVYVAVRDPDPDPMLFFWNGIHQYNCLYKFMDSFWLQSLVPGSVSYLQFNLQNSLFNIRYSLLLFPFNVPKNS
jgi:hypothetical protein